MPLYALTIFLSAFLLFQVQPMAAKFILPWFGGSTLVWTTCMLFFQLALVAGYAYSHGIATKLGRRGQLILHGVIVLAALVLLPIRPEDSWKPVDGNYPVQRILQILFFSVGVPFFLLSTTGPLIQRWQSLTHPHQSPYRLYALSNFGSLLALVSYPFVMERWFDLDWQSWLWSGTFLLFASSLAGSAIQFAGSGKSLGLPSDSTEARTSQVAEGEFSQDSVIQRTSLRWWQVLMWLALPAMASVQLLATTNLMTQEIGSHPLLWIVPLSLYLLTFIICFEFNGFYLRWMFAVGLFVTSVFSCMVLSEGINAGAAMQIFGFSGVLFFSAMCCHGELVYLKPDSSRLTLFYLMISIGGAVGGVIVAVAAPRIFSDYYEFHLSLLVVIVWMVAVLAHAGWRFFQERWVTGSRVVGFWGLQIIGVASLFVVCGFLYSYWRVSQAEYVLQQSRNAYGTLRVNNSPTRISLVNGHTSHGFQLFDEQWNDKPVSYYGPDSGLGVAIEYLRVRKQESATEPESIDIAAIGLGVGTVAAWTEPGDSVHFFEINSAVELIARRFFSYLDSANGDVQVSIGDARIQLERQRESAPERKCDILVADAFSSDSIPVHLMTLEAFQLYADSLKPGGMMAIHTSNRFLVLDNIVRENAKQLGWKAVLLRDSQPENQNYFTSTWVVVTKDEAFLDTADVAKHRRAWNDEKYTHLWTDESASLLQVLRW